VYHQEGGSQTLVQGTKQLKDETLAHLKAEKGIDSSLSLIEKKGKNPEGQGKSWGDQNSYGPTRNLESNVVEKKKDLRHLNGWKDLDVHSSKEPNFSGF